ncbi:hypothetical protein BC832DRAFT_318752 [Gaertneriomyces semiglobifer]|nr:hypothetical protein BC832DRAFT_318752 [Gaertneriomyces semiglobifer]
MPKVHRNRWRGTLTDFDARQKAFQAAYHTAAVGDPTLDLIRFDLVSSHRLHVEDSRKRKRIDCDESVAVGSQSSLSSAADKQGDSEVGGIALNAVEPTPIAGKGFEHAVQAIKEARRVGLNSPLYWAALDLRDRGVSPCGDTRRAADLLEPRDIDPIVARFKNIMRQARDESSQSALALLDTLQALKRDLDPPSKLAETILEHGSKAFILSLKDQIRTKKRDAEEAQSQSLCGSPDSDDLQRSVRALCTAPMNSSKSESYIYQISGIGKASGTTRVLKPVTPGS